ncbi:putative membrane protein YdbT with pleckstrin-like domain [Murinocardiopsis flavida]|uniref:Putative membrane protein YdbT with pleckstrin-like domain n=1 Tax=Murinocardiopsis flavida TaxID=645275 RepID=A0A2P8D103_9ACTN|nr:PH domain-containing protein [Murinocardiopsis flavida]PSK90895.1 putative membrane protein YdbT with pleckstrin-like domain [Murinocardiopsis flavida]
MAEPDMGPADDRPADNEAAGQEPAKGAWGAGRRFAEDTSPGQRLAPDRGGWFGDPAEDPDAAGRPGGPQEDPADLPDLPEVTPPDTGGDSGQNASRPLAGWSFADLRDAAEGAPADPDGAADRAAPDRPAPRASEGPAQRPDDEGAHPDPAADAPSDAVRDVPPEPELWRGDETVAPPGPIEPPDAPGASGPAGPDPAAGSESAPPVGSRFWAQGGTGAAPEGPPPTAAAPPQPAPPPPPVAGPPQPTAPPPPPAPAPMTDAGPQEARHAAGQYPAGPGERPEPTRGPAPGTPAGPAEGRRWYRGDPGSDTPWPVTPLWPSGPETGRPAPSARQQRRRSGPPRFEAAAPAAGYRPYPRPAHLPPRPDTGPAFASHPGNGHPGHGGPANGGPAGPPHAAPQQYPAQQPYAGQQYPAQQPYAGQQPYAAQPYPGPQQYPAQPRHGHPPGPAAPPPPGPMPHGQPMPGPQYPGGHPAPQQPRNGAYPAVVHGPGPAAPPGQHPGGNVRFLPPAAPGAPYGPYGPQPPVPPSPPRKQPKPERDITRGAHRVHWATIPLQALVVGLVFLAVPGVLLLEIGVMWALLAWAAVMSGSAVYAATAWWQSSYGLRDDHLVVHSGLVRKVSREVPLSRLQAVDVVRPLVMQAFGLAELRVEVAGGDAGEIRLRYLTRGTAIRLRASLLAHAAGLSGRAPEAPEWPFYKLPFGLLLGAMAFRLPVLGAFVLFLVLIVAGIAFMEPGVLGGAIPLLLGLIRGFFGPLLRYTDFFAALSPDGLRLRYGIFQARMQTVPPGRVQAIRVVEPLLWRSLGVVRVEANVAGYAGERQMDSSTLLPVVPRPMAFALIDELLPGTDVSREQLHGARKSWSGTDALGVDDGAFVTRRGIFCQVIEIVPHARVQTVRISMGPWAARQGLATVEADTPPGPVRARAAGRDAAEARRVVEGVAERAHKARSSGGGPERWATRSEARES